jgi:hypothetical protein
MSRRFFSSLAIAGIAILGAPAAHSATGSKPVDFDRDIRPILSDRCFACHGPDSQKRLANLRLDLKDGGAFSKRGDYTLITPGDSSHSRLYERISASKQRMPPASAGPALTAQQVASIQRWIDEGAKWEVHWSYVAPQRPDLPEVKDAHWARNPIDRFVLARLEREGLKPSSEADKVTLLRRVTFDLTGLPPTPAEVDAFLSDKSPNAYDKRVDELLKSPRYGERMAMQWMDLARYADTHGYHIDSHRDMWHWRDWVISAFNKNLPYSDFIVDQLAGDLLPNATLDQKIATGFNRNHMINFEGGAIPEEYQNEYVVDRVETTSVAFLGMTMGCARCHDHKYDPIAQREFYRFYAFFNTIPEKGLDGRRGNAEPVVQIPSAEQAQSLERAKRELAEAEGAWSEDKVAKLQADWEPARLASLPEPSRDGLLAHYEFDGSLADTSGRYLRGRVLKGDLTYTAGAVDKTAEFDGETQVSFGNTGGFDVDQPFSIATWVRPSGILETDILAKLADSTSRRGYELYIDDATPIGELRRGAHIGFRMTHQFPGDAIEVQTVERLPFSSKAEGAPRPWYHVVVNYDGSGKASGLKLWINNKPAQVTIVKDHLTGTIGNTGSLEIGDKTLSRAYKGQIDDVRLYGRQLQADEIRTLAIDQPARATLLILPDKRAKEQAQRLREYFLSYDAPQEYRQLYARINSLKEDLRRLDEEIPTSMVMADAEKPRDTFVLGRGDYRNHLEKVTPGVPAVLPPLPKDAPLNRLTLARWLIDPAHPLTARVAINHFWQMYFGLGIVKTAENFGSQGDSPSHPELLDWLATEFIRTGWDVKAMQRLIVTSATYRQSSRETPELIEKDPENRLLAHGPRFRLPAEMVRDNALAVSGLLDSKVGGPGVFPYQPKGLWEEIAYGDVFSAQTYPASHPSDLYRRSMYDFWKRTSPPPGLITFDAPDREKCTARRTVTNTPLQALVLMNDPTFIEAARVLAQKTIEEAGADPSKRIVYAFRLATARKPDAKEVALLRDLETAELAQYRDNKAAALKLLHVGDSGYDAKLDPAELAAWTTVTSAILNLDETITKE